ncbi:MAG TPA: hypothetical protein VMV53_03830 [Acidimicrobiales bacterium]|nr:hypothetical protein [Acidimicrobiales bacterium]
MRYLTVVRHAKAEPAALGQSDFERELTKRGRDQCRQLREWATDPTELGRFGPTVALVSAARRTKETYQRAFKGTPFVRARDYSELIYNGRREVSAEDLLLELASIDPVTSSLLVVGHNPTVAEVAATLAIEPTLDIRQGRFPLAGAYVFALPDDRPVGLATYELVATYVPD